MLHHSISRFNLLGFSAILLGFMLSSNANAQTANYHVHKEASSTTGLNQLKTAGTDANTVALNSPNLKSLATGEYIVKSRGYQQLACAFQHTSRFLKVSAA